MLMSIFPDPVTGGGVVYRDEAGNPIEGLNVQNAYSPAPEYIINCPPTALPADCEARVEPKQINNIVSEILAFGECLDPDGPWDCNSVTNLCAAFDVWAAQYSPNLFIRKAGDTMTGPLILARDPIEDMEAVTKQYVQQYLLPDVLDGGTF
jgi:hypothetical protein